MYNGEAIEAERFSRSLTKGEATLNEEAIYLQPLKFDAEVYSLSVHIDCNFNDLFSPLLRLQDTLAPWRMSHV